jgi:two-component system sensor histidine kinase BaeS
MRTKLFVAFFSVIVVALISNLIFEKFMVQDFEDYVRGSKEDKLYWVLAAVEGSYNNGVWNKKALHDSVHWAMMLGFDVTIIDGSGSTVLNSELVMESLSPAMRRRMEGIIDIKNVLGNYEIYPLYQSGQEIGEMSVRLLKRRGSIDEKDTIFKERGREFLVFSFVIAGGGAIFLSFFFTIFLSRPINKMKKAVESMAKGDFSVRVPTDSKDEIGRLADSFNFMAEALQREEALRKHLTSNIAHELRTPLSVMKANVEAMIDGVVHNKEEGLENIRMEVEKLIRLVEGIEDITKAEASFFLRRDYTKFDLADCLSAIVVKMQPLAAEKGLDVKLVSNKPVKVLSDPGKLETIVQNILVNAIKYTQTGGIWMDYGIDEDVFFIEIRDSGRGIPEDILELIFKRFYREEDSRGIGLGLAIVRELAEVMGGRVEVKSKVGEGTVFTVLLPRKS